MKTASHPTDTASRVVLHGVHCELTDDLRAAALERASRLFEYNDRIEMIEIELQRESPPDSDSRYIAKARIEFGGPALLASVADGDAMHTVDYLIDKLLHQLRRQRRRQHCA